MSSSTTPNATIAAHSGTACSRPVAASMIDVSDSPAAIV
jgi:hypothetical protein